MRKMALVGAVACCILLWMKPILAQAPFPPPNQIQVFNVRGLDFGSFYPSGTGGEVIVDPWGSRTPTGGVVLVGGDIGESAIFEVVLIPGRLVSISFGPEATLTGSNGGSMTLIVGPSDKIGDSFVTTRGHPFRNPVFVGGTLDVGNNSPAGEYYGTFSVTFIQE